MLAATLCRCVQSCCYLSSAAVARAQGQKRQFGKPGVPGEVALQLYAALTALQQEEAQDPFGWVVPV